MPGELDVVRIEEAVHGWPQGTTGTLVEVFGREGVVEVEDEARFDLLVVPYSAMTVLWTAGRAKVVG